MMLPKAKEYAYKTKKRQLSFEGLDYSAAPKEGSLLHTKNLSSEAYPYLSVREDRKEVATLTQGAGLGNYNGLYYVDGTDFYYQGKIRGTVSAGKKKFAVMCQKIIIFPDKLCYNIEEDTMEPIQVSFSYTLPPSDGKLVFDKNTITYQGEEDDFSFVQMGFRAGDGLTVEGFYTGEEEGLPAQEIWYGENNQTIVVRRVEDRVLVFSDNSFIPVTPTDAMGKSISIAREVPDLEVVTEWNNRLWGTKGNTIYASKPGEPENFFVYEGISTDSYAIAVGTGGSFTACARLGSCLLFFKEDGVHTVYGSRPQNFRVQWKPMPGVAKGCEDSLAILPNGLFYYNQNGPYLYNGATCTFLGNTWGDKRFFDVVASYDGRLVYAAMTDEAGNRGLYTFNTQNNMWLREDDLAVEHLCYDGKVMYFMTKSGLYQAKGGNRRVQWEAEFNPILEKNPFQKRYFRLWLRVQVPDHAYVCVAISMDGAPYTDCGCLHEKGVHLLPLHVPPCHSFSLRFSGEGACRLQDFTREYTEF